jgi:phage terminase small subunit
MSKRKPQTEFPIPTHLLPATQAWVAGVMDAFVLEEHHVRVLVLAAEAWDRCQAARAAISRHGLTYNDRFGAPRLRPEVAVERDSRIGFTRCLRELGLDISQPESPRPPRTGGQH